MKERCIHCKLEPKVLQDTIKVCLSQYHGDHRGEKLTGKGICLLFQDSNGTADPMREHHTHSLQCKYCDHCDHYTTIFFSPFA